MHVEVYTDGSALPSNPGHGGAASVILYGDRIVLIAKYLGSFVTSIESELLAIERSLKYCVCNLQVGKLDLYTDSKYAAMSIAGQYRTTLRAPRTRSIRSLLISPELHKKVTLFKVAAHKNPEDYSSERDKTAIYWNSVVDTIAKKAASEGEGYFFIEDMTLEKFKQEYFKVKKE
jgi:ribonuclease HI